MKETLFFFFSSSWFIGEEEERLYCWGFFPRQNKLGPTTKVVLLCHTGPVFSLSSWPLGKYAFVRFFFFFVLLFS